MTTPPGQWPPPGTGPGQQPPSWGQQPPSWGQQPPWGPPPPSGGNQVKWILGGLALVVVVVLTVVVTLAVTRDSSGSEAPTASAPPPATTTSVDSSEFASAGDDGPIEIITDEPTCPAWTPIGDTLAQKAAQGWNDRDPSIPASEWTPAQRAQYEDIAKAMLSAADQTTALVKLTPHRVVRELYEQSIAYWRAYADRIANYTPTDNHLAQVAAATANSLVWICSAIHFGSAAARGPLVPPSATPLEVASIGNPDYPTRFMTTPSDVCKEWADETSAFDVATAVWLGTDAGIPASQWGPEQQQIYVEMSTVMRTNAATIQDLGMRSNNPVFYDFATLAAQYRRAFVQSFPSYVPADAYLANTAAELVAANNHACLAAG